MTTMSTTPSQVGRPELTLPTQILHSSAALANTLKQTGLSMFLLLFYNQVVGLDPRVVTAAIMVTLVFDAFVDPMIGTISDNLRTPLGRRHPFMYASAIPVAIAFYAIWNPPHGWSDQAMFVYMLACLLSIRLFDSFNELPSTALTPELTTDYDKRTRLLSFRSFFNIFGRFLLIVSVYQVFMRQNPDGTGGVTSHAGWHNFSIAAAIAIATIILVSASSTHKFIPYLSKPAKREKIRLGEMLKEVGQSLNNRSFLAMAVAGIVLAVGTGLRQGLDVYLGLFYWSLTQQQLTLMVMATLTSSTVGVLFLAPQVAKRVGKKTAAQILGWTGITLSCTPIVLDQLGFMPARHTPELFNTLWSFEFITPGFMSGTGVMISAMIADCVDDVAVKTGRRSEGLLFSADNLFKKAVSGLGVLISGEVLYLAHFPANAREVGVDPSSLDALAWMYVGCWLALNGGCLTAMLFYKITREQHAENVRKLAQMSAAQPSPATEIATPLTAPAGPRERPSEA